MEYKPDFRVIEDKDYFIRDEDEDGNPDNLTFTEVIQRLRELIHKDMSEAGTYKYIAEMRGMESYEVLLVLMLYEHAIMDLHKRYHEQCEFIELVNDYFHGDGSLIEKAMRERPHEPAAQPAKT